MDALRESINLRGYAQRGPKIEYQREGFALFGEMEQRIDHQLAEFVFKFGYPRPRVEAHSAPRPAAGAGAAASDSQSRAQARAGTGAGQAGRGGAAAAPAAAAAGMGASTAAGGPVGKVGRNEPCPCGSGKKYKKCCGA
jgi:preprotein translocase subunit SecA